MKNKPIYTIKTECQDCYKCLRECPVKAIEVKDNHANIIHDNCILCGHCTHTCPVNAKHVRNDITKVKDILSTNNQTYVSLAPSYISEYRDHDYRQLIHALKRLGFSHVSETALGAQEVSAHLARQFACTLTNELLISSACPSVVQYILKYYPECAKYITPLVSPVIAHGKNLKRLYGNNIKIVFIGPCIAKKDEIDANSDIIDATLTFEELNQWLDEEQIDITRTPININNTFVPHKAEEGSIYPVDGGMIESIKNANSAHFEYMSFSGLTAVKNALESIPEIELTSSMFLELLACEGGCINGPKSCTTENTVPKRIAVLGNTIIDNANLPRKPELTINCHYLIKEVNQKKYSEHNMVQALRSIGKFTLKDELNCGGCGYNSCRDFTRALIEQKAEKTMCLSYMRKLAQKKADTLLQAMPSGAVMIDSTMKIVECNRQFAILLGEEIEYLFTEKPGLEGVNIKKLFPDHFLLFTKLFETDVKNINKEICFNNKYFHLSIFTIEDDSLIGAILQDITEPSVHKEGIIKKAEQVIEKNIRTVQQIAFLLGENAAESEVILNSIVESFRPELKE